jgi:hypothetical protein
MVTFRFTCPPAENCLPVSFHLLFPHSSDGRQYYSTPFVGCNFERGAHQAIHKREKRCSKGVTTNNSGSKPLRFGCS